eukprot:4236072-Pleurochrysis_carterae.AAC.3
MRKQIQEVLRRAGEESSKKGTVEEREDLRGVEVNSVQQLYVSVRGMTTSAATNKCEFGYTTPSGEELRWGPTKLTLHAEYHRRSLKVKENSARTYHTVRGALVLNDQATWCELCAWAHGKGCEKLRAYRAEENRRTDELMARARRETAPTRAQRQATRPEYTLSVEMEKQVRSSLVHSMIDVSRGGKDDVGNVTCLPHAGAGGNGAQDLRGGGEGNRRSKGRTTNGAQRGQNADGLPGFQDPPGKFPVYAAEVQVLSLQPPQTGDARRAQRSSAGRRKKRENAGVAARRQRRRGKGSGIEPERRMGRERQLGSRWEIKRPRVDGKMSDGKGETWRGESAPRDKGRPAKRRRKPMTNVEIKEAGDNDKIHAFTRATQTSRDCDYPIDGAIYCAICNDMMTLGMTRKNGAQAGTRELWTTSLVWLLVFRF